MIFRLFLDSIPTTGTNISRIDLIPCDITDLDSRMVESEVEKKRKGEKRKEAPNSNIFYQMMGLEV